MKWESLIHLTHQPTQSSVNVGQINLKKKQTKKPQQKMKTLNVDRSSTSIKILNSVFISGTNEFEILDIVKKCSNCISVDCDGFDMVINKKTAPLIP